jgi:hypothetical protein
MTNLNSNYNPNDVEAMNMFQMRRALSARVPKSQAATYKG